MFAKMLQNVADHELLLEITRAEEVPVCLHGTTYKAWEIIAKEGLSKMRRNHIHFSAGEFGSAAVCNV